MYDPILDDRLSKDAKVTLLNFVFGIKANVLNFDDIKNLVKLESFKELVDLGLIKKEVYQILNCNNTKELKELISVY